MHRLGVDMPKREKKVSSIREKKNTQCAKKIKQECNPNSSTPKYFNKRNEKNHIYKASYQNVYNSKKNKYPLTSEWGKIVIYSLIPQDNNNKTDFIIDTVQKDLKNILLSRRILPGNSLVVQWLRTLVFTAKGTSWFLVGKLRSHKSCVTAPKKEYCQTQKNIYLPFIWCSQTGKTQSVIEI